MGTNFDSVILHYDEIGVKGKNRSYFERLLINNIKKKLQTKSIKREEGQITLIPKTKNYDKIKDALSKIPGIAYFSFSKKASLDFEKLKKQALAFVKNLEFTTFKVDTHRHNKRYKLNSMEVNALLGEVIINKFGKKVKMKKPDLLLKVEISNKASYLSQESIQGVGGMPIEPNKKVISLLSGGFDSPVAAYMMMKRGCQVVFVHFHNKNQASQSVHNKIVNLVKQLSKFQNKSKLYIVPFEKIQKEIIMKAPAKTRMLVYRRFMLKIASKIAEKENAKFLVVGDSLSQVASQTMENLEVTYKASEKHIFSPLIGLNKKEIIDISKKIGTFDISAQPYGDCCSYFLPKHPVLRARIGEIEDIESTFDVEKLVSESVISAKVKGI